MSSVKLEWDQFSIVDSFNIYRSMTPMDAGSLPAPIGTTTSKEYVDYSVEVDTTYYYRVSAIRGADEKLGSEVSVFTSDDPSASHLTNHLTFSNSDLFDLKQEVDWSANNGTPVFVTSAGKIALSTSKPFYIASPNTLSTSSVFSMVMDITFTGDPSYSQDSFFTISMASGSYLEFFRFGNGSGIICEWNIFGDNGTIEVPVSLPNNSRFTIKITKESSGTTKIYINDVLTYSGTHSFYVYVASVINIGRSITNSSRGLNAIVHEFKYYHNYVI